jgi:ABC-type transport system involved in multi-copper enzyme maturation permease subunit
MLRAELFKIRTHRLPKLLLAVTILGLIGPSIVLIFYTPSTRTAHATSWAHVFEILPSISAIVFGGWVLGTEYRQDTIKRLLASEPRRIRALAVKALVGGAVLVIAVIAVALIGWTTARGVGALKGYTVAWNPRQLLPGALFAFGAAPVAFALSAIARSDALAMVATLALVLILDPLLGMIPTFGKYTFAGALETLTSRAGGSAGGLFDTTLLTNTQAAITLAVWLSIFIGVATHLFSTRDV